jgi:acyl-CoA reductase-like NAD-dependent aldehyde dehydrogenase
MVNDSEYGLGGTDWTSGVGLGISLAGRIESGTVWVNRHRVLPFDLTFLSVVQSSRGWACRTASKEWRTLPNYALSTLTGDDGGAAPRLCDPPF